MEPLKYMFTPQVIEQAATVADKIIVGFDKKAFTNQVLDSEWQTKELKDRYQHIARVLWHFLPKEYDKAVDYLIEISEEVSKLDHPQTVGAFPYMFLPTVIEFYGLHDFENSMRGLEKITQLISAEFAVRPFFIEYPEKMLAQSMEWTNHKSEHVRRLASEGARPALPWGMALTQYKKNPNLLIPILENLKADTSLYVRKSVANTLNDISKTHPELVIELASKWKGNSEDTDWIIKHASRTLLKAGNPAIMQIFGYANSVSYNLNNIEFSTQVEMGKELDFSFEIANKENQSIKTRIEYAVYFLRQKDKYGKKVFMLSDTFMDPLSCKSITKKHSFRPISTRKYYPGTHYFSIIINGVEIKKEPFEIVN